MPVRKSSQGKRGERATVIVLPVRMTAESVTQQELGDMRALSRMAFRALRDTMEMVAEIERKLKGGARVEPGYFRFDLREDEVLASACEAASAFAGSPLFEPFTRIVQNERNRAMGRGPLRKVSRLPRRRRAEEAKRPRG